MDSFYIFIIVALIVLAIVDLTVGVANDAVNFLNSGIGSKVAARWVVLAVASAGIMAGTLTSNGLMEIARSGVFDPGMFTFNDVMMIFLGVMICDVIMLDIFNTLGLPTSTTVSLIFELLGAAVFVALYKMWTMPPEEVGMLSQYINSAGALRLISAILASIIVSFIFGSIIMYVSRLLFSFRYKRAFRRFGAVWCGLSLTAIAYFALFKGLRFSTIISREDFQWLSDNIQLLLLIVFVGSTIILAIMQLIFRINILKIIVLAGTFALAMAFAGSDLVNFIGVTMAGVASFEYASTYAAAGGDISSLTMENLKGPVSVHIPYLLLAGGIMVSALWFSRKARTVTDTEVNLSRQGDGDERFGSWTASRFLVRSAKALNKGFTAILPERVNNFIDSRFKTSNYDLKHKASFDLIRAAVNLTVAALLISTATSMKLTLSTTYVTFMVAMATSLSDRAWGRESAVYRITGVLTVVSGWFVTALVAFSASAVIALLLMWGGKFAIVGLLVLCVFMLIQSSIFHKKRRKEKEQRISVCVDVEKSSVIKHCKEEIYMVFEQMSHLYTQTLKGLAEEDHKKLKKLYKEAKNLYTKEKNRRTYEMLPTLIQLQEDTVNTGHYYVQVRDYLYEVSKSLMAITKESYEYIDNNHTGFSQSQINDLEEMNKAVAEVYTGIVNMLKTSDFSDFERILAKRDSIFDLFVDNIKSQIKRVKDKESSTRNSILFINIIGETKTMVLQSRNMMKAQRLFLGYEEGDKITTE